MRFHCGISFSWKTIKKFLIPFLIGIMGCLGFKWINDNKDNLPLGFINLFEPLKVSASSNYDTRFDIDYSSVSNINDMPVDTGGTKLVDFIDTIKNNTSLTREYSIVLQFSNSIVYIYFYVFDTSTNYTFNLYGDRYKNLNYVFTSSNYTWLYKQQLNGSYPPSDIYNSYNYNQFITCASGGSCQNNSSFPASQSIFRSSTDITDSSNNTLSFDISRNFLFYYSTFPLHISNTYDINNNSIFYKSIYIDNQSIDVGENFPTYYDYTHPITPEPEPEPEPEPTPEEVVHKALFNKVYWFDDNTTEIGILSSIYICLFLYCITMLILKVLSIVKSKRW